MNADLHVTAPEGARLLCTVLQADQVLGYLAIDSTVGGRSCGGLRLLPDVGDKEMLALATAMTLKYGFLGLPQGGAKAGVRGDPEAPQGERRQRLETFAKAIAPLLRRGVYAPGPDMGTDNEDIRNLLRSIGMRPKRRELRGKLSGYYTALSVFVSARETARHLGLELSGQTVAVEGFGKVGSSLATLLDEAHARVVAISTSRGGLYEPNGLDVKRLADLAGREGSRVIDCYEGAKRVPRESLVGLPVDLLCPCARHDSVTVDNADRVHARVICSGANNPVTPEAEQMLFRRGVLCLPDFVTNCGGVLGGTMDFASVQSGEIRRFMDRHLGARVAWLLSEAERRGVASREVAVSVARRRFEQVRQTAARPTPCGRLFGLALELYRRGLVPGAVVARLSLPYFKRALA